jgi:hypothetical protein
MEYGLPDFLSDYEDSWEYARSNGTTFAVNVTKTEGLDTIATWMEEAPTKANYQIIVFGDPPTNFEGFLCHTLQAEVTAYAKTDFRDRQ